MKEDRLRNPTDVRTTNVSRRGATSSKPRQLCRYAVASVVVLINGCVPLAVCPTSQSYVSTIRTFVCAGLYFMMCLKVKRKGFRVHARRMCRDLSSREYSALVCAGLHFHDVFESEKGRCFDGPCEKDVP